MRILSNADVEKVLTLPDCLDALEIAFKELADGAGANRPRTFTYFPTESEQHPGFRYRFKSQEGGTAASGVWALRIVSDMAGVERLPSGVQRRRLLPVAPGGRYVGLVILFSLTTIEPLAILHDSLVQKIRVGATSALGIRELAREDVRVAGMFGSGWQAESHLEYLLLIRPSIEEVRVFSPTQAHRERFAEVWSARTGRRIRAVDAPRDAVVGCQIVTAATAAMDACFDGSWLEPGTHVTCITNPDGTVDRRELDDCTYDRADLLAVTSKEQIHHDKQVDILGPVERGLKTWDQITDLGDLLHGRGTRRTSDEQLSVFANNTGMGIQFAAVCSRILQRCEEAGLGHEVPTEWFLEETSP